MELNYELVGGFKLISLFAIPCCALWTCKTIHCLRVMAPTRFLFDKTGGFKYLLFSSLLGEMIQSDEHIFQRGWFNHHLDEHVVPRVTQ